MGLSSAFYLILLAAIWGASFLFMRIGAPSLGGVWLIEFRVGFAALFLFIVTVWLKKTVNLRAHWRHYAFVGVMSAALPFVCYGYAAQYLTASLMSVINALTPIFGTAISALYFRHGLPSSKIVGLCLGVIGVAVIVGLDPELLHTDSWFAVLIVMCAPLCYGIVSTYVQTAEKIDPIVNSYGSMLLASLALLPFLFFIPPTAPEDIDLVVILSVLALGVICTGLAFLIFFKLLDDVGMPSTLTVTFLIPVFGVLWGVLFLGEQVGWHTLIGTLLVIAGTIKTTGFSLKAAMKTTS
ncbi:DMT family transporter [Marinomonas agarivorans]|nr:DMT family transporter [Marinomonas agarivorans]